MTVLRGPHRIRRDGRHAAAGALLALLTLLPVAFPGAGAARLIAQGPPSRDIPPAPYGEARIIAILDSGPRSGPRPLLTGVVGSRARDGRLQPFSWPTLREAAPTTAGSVTGRPPARPPALTIGRADAFRDAFRPAPRTSIPVLGDSRMLAQLGLEIERAERNVREVRRALFGSRGILGLGSRSGERERLVRLRFQYEPDPGVRFVVLEPRALIP